MIFKPNKVVKKKRSKYKKLARLAPIIVVFFLVAGMVAGRAWYLINLRPVSSERTPTKVTIEKGASEDSISKTLKDKKLIKSELAFKTYVKNSKYSGLLKSGTYELDPTMSTKDIVEILGGGKEASTLFTIVPGLRLDQIRNRFIKA